MTTISASNLSTAIFSDMDDAAFFYGDEFANHVFVVVDNAHRTDARIAPLVLDAEGRMAYVCAAIVSVARRELSIQQ